jgi:hypothetical protein
LVARPRVILACDNADIAVRMIDALNPRRYRVEHIFDPSEALLRAELVLAHALVFYGHEATESLERRSHEARGRLSLVFVSPDGELEPLATRLGATHLLSVFGRDDFKRAVYKAVSEIHELRKKSPTRHRPRRRRSSSKRALLVVEDTEIGSVMTAIINRELGILCDVAVDLSDALLLLETTVDCVVASPAQLMARPEGHELARMLARRGVPLIPLNGVLRLDVSSAAQMAWDIVPQLRRSLTARSDEP